MAARYLVSADHPSPQQVKDRLDAVIARELPRTLARAFDSWFSESDQSIWIIRQLNIETAINVTGDPEHITRALTAQIAKNLGATLHDGNQDNVRYFPNRAEYLASFLSDLAFGTAWSQWYYQSFAGLNALPLSAALRTAICDDIAIGMGALGFLATAELQQVVQSLTAQDARQVLERLALEGPAGDKSRCREAVVRTTTKNDAALPKIGNEWQRALYLFIAATQEEKGLGGSSLGETPDAQVLVHPRSTVFGGIFLILPHLDELPLVEATRDWPHADEAAAISLVRFLVLLKCCGRENSERAFYDPLLRDLLLIPPTLSPAMLRAWQLQLKPEHLQNFLATLLERQCSRGAIAGKEQLLTVSKFRGRSLLVLVDAGRGLWLLVDRCLPHGLQEIIESLRPRVAMLMEEEGVLYSDPSLISLLQAKFAGLTIVDASAHVIDLAEAEMRGIDTILARLDELPNELEFLTLPASIKIGRPLDLVLSIAAQHLLRGIAWRLPGFARSNLPYLSSNFLEFTANVEEEPARRVVRVGCPPLHLILNMTGMTRQSYPLSWLDERPFALFQGE
ncbi:MAG TPA: hypothetical protein VGK77_28085 [Candidatus Binatia bacterium]